MKNYSFFDPYKKAGLWKAWRNYIIELDTDIWSLYNYINTFNPNYLVFNMSVNQNLPYFEEDELKKLELINIDEDKQKLLFYANKLPYHKGLYNNFTRIPTDKRYYTFSDDAHKELWKEGTVIISQVKPTLPKFDIPDNRSNKKDYLIARIAAAASFYIFTGTQDSIMSWTLLSKAENKYTTAFETSIIPGQPRFIGGSWWGADGISILNYQANQNQDSLITTQIGSKWLKAYEDKDGVIRSAYLLNHDLYWYCTSNNDLDVVCEDFIADDSYEIKFDTAGVPIYNIHMELESKLNSIIYTNLW